MNIRQSFFTLILATLGLGGLPSAAGAFTLSHLNSDAAFDSLVPNPSFVAQGRIGDLGGVATYELDLHEANPGLPISTADFDWQPNVAQAFQLTYDKASNLATYTVGGSTMNYSPTNPFTDLFIRTRSVVAGSNITIDNLMLNGQSIMDSSHADGSTANTLDYLRIGGLSNDSFTLTGNTTMNWLGNPQVLADLTAPHQSQLAFQIKAVSVATSVPEPASMSLMSVGVGVLAMYSRRRKHTV
jgi:hypothetical protein